MDIFNNREIASAIWLIVAFIFFSMKRDIREAFYNVFNCFFNIKIQISILIMIAYMAGIVTILYLLNLWEIFLLKDTIIWFCFSGYIMTFNILTSSKQENLFQRITKNIVIVVIIIEFLINTYTFSLGIELLLIPFIIIITLLDAIAETSDEYKSLLKLINGLQFIIMGSILIYATTHAILDFKNLGNINTFRSVLLAPLLTIFFLPLIYSMLVFSAYEKLFLRLNLGYEKSKKLKNNVKKKIIGHCKFSLQKLNKALNMNTYNLMQIRNEKDIHDMVKSYKRQV